MHVLYNPKSNGEALHRKRGSMAKSDFSENHSKGEKGLKVQSDASTELSMTKAKRKPKGYCHPKRSRGISSKG